MLTPETSIAQSWSENETMDDSYSPDQLKYLKNHWQKNIKGKSKWDYEDCFWPKEGLYVTVEGRVLMCPLNTGAKDFGNIFSSSLSEIRESEDFINVKYGCENNCPTTHCKNCSYKELTPILQKLGVNN